MIIVQIMRNHMQLKSKHFVHSFKGGAQMENAFFSILEGHNFKIFSPLSAHHWEASPVAKYVTNSMPKKSLGSALKIAGSAMLEYITI